MLPPWAAINGGGRAFPISKPRRICYLQSGTCNGAKTLQESRLTHRDRPVFHRMQKTALGRVKATAGDRRSHIIPRHAPYTSSKPLQRLWQGSWSSSGRSVRPPPSFGIRRISSMTLAVRCSGMSWMGSPLSPAFGSPEIAYLTVLSLPRRAGEGNFHTEPRQIYQSAPASRYSVVRNIQNAMITEIPDLLHSVAKGSEPLIISQPRNVFQHHGSGGRSSSTKRRNSNSRSLRADIYPEGPVESAHRRETLTRGASGE